MNDLGDTGRVGSGGPEGPTTAAEANIAAMILQHARAEAATPAGRARLAAALREAAEGLEPSGGAVAVREALFHVEAVREHLDLLATRIMPASPPPAPHH